MNSKKRKIPCKSPLQKRKINIAGKDWINSKYKKIISYLTALIRKSNEALEKSLNVRDSLSSLLCTLQNSSEFWTDMPFVPLHSMKNCWFLDENYYEPLKYDKYKHMPVKQRTDEWHRLRNGAFVTGCTEQQAWMAAKYIVVVWQGPFFNKRKKKQVKIFAEPCSMAQIMK